MNTFEEITYIIDEKYYMTLFEAISTYLKDNLNDFCYTDSIWSDVELYLKDYSITNISFQNYEGTTIIEMLVDARIFVFDCDDLGYDTKIVERFRLSGIMDADNKFKVAYIGLCLGEFD